jgi:hypothetical protein
MELRIEAGQDMRDDFTEDVKRSLAARVGAVCSNPDCCALTTGPRDDPTKAVNVGVAAHITSAAAGGPRYNLSLSQEERRASNNGIWLCQNCAKLVDNDVARFPEELLRAWKTVAEHRARNSLGKTAPDRAESESQRKAREIQLWVGKSVTLSHMNTGSAVMMLGPVRGSSQVQVFDCTEFFVIIGKTGQDSWSRSISLTNIDISFDRSRNCLELQERYS